MAISLSQVKRVLIGEPFPTHREIHERLDKVRALAIFASDPISSNAYATEAIMSVLILIGAGALNLTLPLALGIMGLVLLVVFSYIQTILHYPDGGGAYTVTKDNLGRMPSLFAGSALLIDYILTVSVSVSAGVRAITSAVPGLIPYSVLLALVAIALLTWINLRGVRESGTIFAIPTYLFVLGVLLTVLLGLARFAGLFGLPAPVAPPIEGTVETAGQAVTGFLFIWLVLRAFAAGCTALTGIEAISNGVQAFKPPESKNAAATMVAMGVIAMSLFLGITYVATHLNLIPYEEESILSQMTRAVTKGFPGGTFLYYWVQFFTMMILILAANTGYQDFPRLSSFLAKDGFLPRWMTNRGDRLVYNYGIVTLAVIASVVVIIFHADEIAMLPLYALGVMLSFTLSQSGMFHLMGRIAHLKPGEKLKTDVTEVHYEKGTTWKRLLNGFGAFVTGIVLIILIATKFMEGAWIVVVAIPLVVFMFTSIRRHYGAVAEALTTSDFSLDKMHDVANMVIVPIADIHRGTIRALTYAKRISTQVRAVYIATNEESKQRLIDRWAKFPTVTEGVELICLDYSYRDILTPLEEYVIKVNDDEFPGEIVTVVIPEFVPASLPAQILHNQTANLLRMRLRHQEDVVIIDVPYQVNG
ncbi:MAG: APC family permease [Anaerolineales bacterium]|nr:APC family permease [Anaerolineales bacterium]